MAKKTNTALVLAGTRKSVAPPATITEQIAALVAIQTERDIATHKQWVKDVAEAERDAGDIVKNLKVVTLKGSGDSYAAVHTDEPSVAYNGEYISITVKTKHLPNEMRAVVEKLGKLRCQQPADPENNFNYRDTITQQLKDAMRNQRIKQLLDRPEFVAAANNVLDALSGKKTLTV